MKPNLRQAATLTWMRRTRPAATTDRAKMLVYLGSSSGYEHAVIFPDGSYATVRFGERHDPPNMRVVR